MCNSALLRLGVSLLTSVASVSLPHLTAAAQARTIVADAPTCATCRIVLDRTVELSPPPAGMPSAPADVNVDELGRIHVGFGPPAEYMRFSSTGDFLGGWQRPGEGPGEFKMIRNVMVTRADSLILLDPILRRASVLTQDGRFVRSFPAPVGLGTPVEIGDGRFVFNEMIGQADRIGFPFHEFSRPGLIGRSFGSEHGNLRPTEHWRLRYFTTPARSSGGDAFWGIREVGTYTIELWGVGERAPRRVIARDAPWYPPFPESGTLRPSVDRPPQPKVVGFWQDESGLLWVALRVPDRRWRSAIVSAAPVGARRGAASEGLGVEVTNPGHYTDTRIEVIDPVRGRLVAVQQFDLALWGGSGRGMLLRKAPNSDPDDPTWAVVWPNLVGLRE